MGKEEESEEYYKLIVDVFHIRHFTTDEDWSDKAAIMLDKYINTTNEKQAIKECTQFIIDFIKPRFNKDYRITLTRSDNKESINDVIHDIKGVKIMCSHRPLAHKGYRVSEFCQIIFK